MNHVEPHVFFGISVTFVDHQEVRGLDGLKHVAHVVFLAMQLLTLLCD